MRSAAASSTTHSGSHPPAPPAWRETTPSACAEAALRRLHGLARSDADREADREADRLLERVHLSPELGDRRPSDLSGGERQRVVLARALDARPRALVCDEPTSALDTTVQAAVCDLLAELRDDRGLAGLLICHNLGVVARLADSVAILDQGRIVERGPTATVLDHPTSPAARALVAAAPSLRSTLQHRSTPSPTASSPAAACPQAPTASWHQVNPA